MPGYNPIVIEKKWQAHWAQHKVFATGLGSEKPKYYVLDMFPYPSGQGLHVGHPEGYTATDIVARYKRAKGFNVMHPMGWDAFGLPAEQYAIKNNVHPRETTAKNINRFRQQLQALGFSYDWDREVDTTDPHYYKWTQWIFLKLYDTWFDETQQKGRSIGELVEEFKSGKRPVYSNKDEDEVGTQIAWDALTPTEQRQYVDSGRLAFQREADVNWCPGLGTVLANEEVIDGKSEVGGFPVERRPMKQWMLRITDYSERLLEGLDRLDWSESLKTMQKNWIGRSEGATVTFDIAPPSKPSSRHSVQARTMDVFTTRPDTLYGVTYLVLSPEHPMVTYLTTDEQLPEVEKYQAWAASRSDRERQEDTKKTGVFTGAYAINPIGGEQAPIYLSDYVLSGYGTGAIMAVPAHDDRDFEFAQKFSLSIRQVVRTGDSDVGILEKALTEEGFAVNSPLIEGLPTQQAKTKMIAILEEKKAGEKKITYKLRDWLFSRQRYWGEPFPLIHLQDGTTVGLAETELPLTLPELEDFKPTGTIDPPLSKATDWVNVHVVLEKKNGVDVARVVAAGSPGAVPARRELNTMPQWAGSCWYYIRYVDPKNSDAFVDPATEKYWLGNSGNGGGVDLYVGGVEHAVLHLLYARFWHKVLFDRGLVSYDEPFKKLVNQGLILGEAEYRAFKSESGQYVSIEFVAEPEEQASTVKRSQELPALLTVGQAVHAEQLTADQVEKRGEAFVLKSDPTIRIDGRSFKMSKSRGNVVNPDDVIKDYGADSLRMFEMFMGPLEQVKPWSTTGVEGVYRFLQRVWRNLFDENDSPKVRDDAKSDDIDRALQRLIKKIGEDIEKLSFNTAIAAMMEFNNLVAKSGAISRASAITFVRLLEPFAPHFAEEVYSLLVEGKGEISVSHLTWPAFDPAMLIDATIELPVQINGKVRSRIMLPNDADEASALAAALADAEVQKHIAGKELKKKIYVKGRMVNLVV